MLFKVQLTFNHDLIQAQQVAARSIVSFSMEDKYRAKKRSCLRYLINRISTTRHGGESQGKGEKRVL
jgi:hypothetical protein